MREVRLQWLRPDEINAEKERVSVVFLPIGPLEWHGPHLPIGRDPLQAEQTVLQMAQKLGGVVHPTLFLGTERERSPELLKDLGCFLAQSNRGRAITRFLSLEFDTVSIWAEELQLDL